MRNTKMSRPIAKIATMLILLSMLSIEIFLKGTKLKIKKLKVES